MRMIGYTLVVMGFLKFVLSFVSPVGGLRGKNLAASMGLSMSSSMSSCEVDVAVLGGGIAGHAIAFLLQEREDCRVVMVDPALDLKAGTWYPNYGEWQEEWEELARRLELPELSTCTTHVWPKTDCFFGGSHGIPTDQRTRLDRAYVRLDREKIQWLLRSRYERAGGKVIPSRLTSRLIAPNLFDKNLAHDVQGSTLTLDDGTTVRAKVVVDTTGFESRLVQREAPSLARGNPKELPTGYQIAYGFSAEVTSPGTYDMGCMTLFDYRTTHFEPGSAAEKDGNERPTFMYAMPMKKLGPDRYRIFFEETSLVGRGDRRLSFEECKERAMARLQHHNVQVLEIEDEEYCYIPMGGELPELGQRVIAFGGAANMVHPSTGYQACRMLAAATDVSAAIGGAIREGSPDKVSSDAYLAMWSPRTRAQRDFQAYGGDFLMQQSVSNLRGFFDAFFSVSQEMWAGFLAGWPGLTRNPKPDPNPNPNPGPDPDPNPNLDHT